MELPGTGAGYAILSGIPPADLDTCLRYLKCDPSIDQEEQEAAAADEEGGSQEVTASREGSEFARRQQALQFTLL